MKIIITSFLFFITIFTSYCQNTIVDSTNHYIKIVENPSTANDLIKSFSFFQSKQKESIDKNNFPTAIVSMYYKAAVQNKLGDIYGSEKTTIEALNLLNSLEKGSWVSEMKLTLLNHLGITNRKLFRFKKSIEYYDQILKITGNSLNTSKAYGNKGKVYADWGKLDLAIVEYEKAINIASTTKDQILLARLLDNLGDIKSQLNISGAKKDLEEALVLRKKYNFNQGILSSYIHLSSHYYRTNDLKGASYNLNQAIVIADSSGNVSHKQAVYSTMIDQGNYARVSDYKKLSDSLRNSSIINDTKYSNAKYNYSEQEKIAADTRLRLKDSEILRTKERSKTIIAIIISVSIIVLSAFLFLFFKSKHTKEKQQKVLETESRISKKIHDELANDVYSTMIQLENQTASIPEIIDGLEEIYQNARDISQEKSVYSSNEEFVTDLKRILGSFKSLQTNLIVKGLNEGMWLDISDLKKVATIRVLKELLVNMKKHSEASVVSIIFERDYQKINITYVDNGVGILKKELIDGTGLINAENRIKAIEGKFIFDKSKISGLKINIHIPL